MFIVGAMQTLKIIDQQGFDIGDFSKRWKSARLSAIRSVLNADLLEETELSQSLIQSDEQSLLLKIKNDQESRLYRAIFDSSRKFALSAVRYLNYTFELSDLQEVLPQLGSFCFSGQWLKHNNAFVQKRDPCVQFSLGGVLFCNYWREALDGLVTGLGENERYTRHRSAGHGDQECLDVLFEESFKTPRIVKDERLLRYGVVPDQLLIDLEPLKEKFKNMKINMQLDGFSEGTLYYRLEVDSGVLCGAGGRLMHDLFLKEMKKLYPQYQVQDSSPLAVYGGST